MKIDSVKLVMEIYSEIKDLEREVDLTSTEIIKDLLCSRIRGLEQAIDIIEKMERSAWQFGDNTVI